MVPSVHHFRRHTHRAWGFRFTFFWRTRFIFVGMPWPWISANSQHMSHRHSPWSEQVLNQNTHFASCVPVTKGILAKNDRMLRRTKILLYQYSYLRGNIKLFHKRCAALTEFCSRSEIVFREKKTLQKNN
jgi:hypothetical protein